jgi:hypothetical protein
MAFRTDEVKACPICEIWIDPSACAMVKVTLASPGPFQVTEPWFSLFRKNPRTLWMGVPAASRLEP